jgi:hypothetical protein
MVPSVASVHVHVDTILLAELELYSAKQQLSPEILLNKIVEAGIRELVENRPALEE